jgi:hypothetical protein
MNKLFDAVALTDVDGNIVKPSDLESCELVGLYFSGEFMLITTETY